MKIIFLDVDGVLNSERWFKKRYDKKNPFETYVNPKFVKNLAKIVKRTGAKIVLSASCRNDVKKDKRHHLRRSLAKYGLVIYDYTPDTGMDRGIDIQEWLNHHLNVTNIVILDDETDMCHLKKYLVKTNWSANTKFWQRSTEGLYKKPTKEAIEMLNTPFENKTGKQLRKNNRKKF